MDNKVILIGEGKLWVVKGKSGSWHLPMENELSASLKEHIDKMKEEGEVFLFGDYIAAPSAGASFSGDASPSGGASLSDVASLPGWERVGLRESWEVLPEEQYRAVAKGAELLNWSRSLRFCSVCGSPMRRATEISKICTACGREVFPSLWPAIVVLVIRESPDGDPAKEEALLVHARTLSRPTVKTLVAGFVETGESLEECVAREVKEEADLEIGDIRYVGSQSWPFPHQLMLGFIARYKSGAIRFADGELTSGSFFRRDNLPDLPTLPSLSRRIIDAWQSGRLGLD